MLRLCCVDVVMGEVMMGEVVSPSPTGLASEWNQSSPLSESVVMSERPGPLIGALELFST